MNGWHLWTCGFSRWREGAAEVCGAPARFVATHKLRNETLGCCGRCVDRARRRGYQIARAKIAE